MKTMRAVLAAALAIAATVPATAFASGEVTFGAQNWWQTEREAKLQEFRERPNGAWLESFLVRGQVGSFAATGWGSDLFLKQQAMGLSFDHGIRWQLDLARRTDGSFAYGGKEQFGAGSTAHPSARIPVVA